MIKLNEKNFTLEVTETLHFSHHVLPIIKEIQEEITDEFEVLKTSGEQDEVEGMKYFIETKDNDWDARQKIEFLSEIWNYYDIESYRYDQDISIFDKDIIRKGVERFIEIEFGFDPKF